MVEMQDPLAEFEARASEAERRLAALEKSGVVRVVEEKISEEDKEKALGQPSDLERAEYRIKFLLRALESRDEALLKAEEELAKRDYQIMHLTRALDRDVYGKTN